MNITAIRASDLRNNFAKIALRVFKGDAAFIVTHHGEAFATLGPIEMFKIPKNIDLNKLLEDAKNQRPHRSKK
jgi:prevent-host-death family protein